jgi:hypothetical protein
MRISFSSIAVLALMSVPAMAQTYDPRFPVCMKVYDGHFGGEWIDCSYASLPQCQATASGRAAICEVNPYFAQPSEGPGGLHRRHRRRY